MKARLPDSLLKRGRNEHPLQSVSEASAIGNQMKTPRLEHFMRATLEGCVFFASTIAKKECLAFAGLGAAGSGMAPVALTSETFAKSDARRDLFLNVNGGKRTRFSPDHKGHHHFVPTHRQNRSDPFLRPPAQAVSACCSPSPCIRSGLWPSH